MERPVLPSTAAARLKQIFRLRPTLAMVLGSGFHHVLTALCVDKKFPSRKCPVFRCPK